MHGNQKKRLSCHGWMCFCLTLYTHTYFFEFSQLTQNGPKNSVYRLYLFVSVKWDSLCLCMCARKCACTYIMFMHITLYQNFCYFSSCNAWATQRYLRSNKASRLQEYLSFVRLYCDETRCADTNSDAYLLNIILHLLSFV